MSNETMAARFSRGGEDEAIWFLTNRITIKARAEETGGAFGMIEAVAPPGFSPPLHVQHGEAEAFLILEGEVTFRVGDDIFRAGPGDFAFVPRHAPHSFVVEGAEPARFLNVITPAGFEQFFADAGRPAEGPGLPPTAPPDIELLGRVSSQYDSELVGPPLTSGAELPG
jgi:mannose-6-phosphate isomerase-like protein (cupin superfamily)